MTSTGWAQLRITARQAASRHALGSLRADLQNLAVQYVFSEDARDLDRLSERARELAESGARLDLPAVDPRLDGAVHWLTFAGRKPLDALRTMTVLTEALSPVLSRSPELAARFGAANEAIRAEVRLISPELVSRIDESLKIYRELLEKDRERFRMYPPPPLPVLLPFGKRSRE